MVTSNQIRVPVFWLLFPLTLVSLAVGSNLLSAACPVCSFLPSRTIADKLLDAKAIVFAREDPERPFSYRVTELLKGSLSSRQIDLFVDSTTRRILREDSEAAVLLVQSRTDGNWDRLTVADSRFQSLVKRIIGLSPQWSGEQGTRNRVQFFLALWGNPNSRIAELAYLEIGKAPYSLIRQFGHAIDIAEIRPMLEKREYYYWRPLAILILAQHATPQAKTRIVEAFQSHQRFSLTVNLAAWATAYIEHTGEAGVEQIRKLYLENPSRSREEIEAVLTALSVHGQQEDLELRTCILQAYSQAIRIHPYSVGTVVRDLLMWKDESGFDKGSEILETGYSLKERNARVEDVRNIVNEN